jgi:hypothetical protein
MESAMSVETILSLRPADASAAAINASIVAATERREQTEQLLKKLMERRGEVFTSGSPQDVREQETAIGDARVQIEQIEALVESLREPLIIATKSERVAELQARKSLNDYAGKVEAFKKAFAHYPSLAAQIVAISVLESEATAARAADMQVNAQLAALGIVEPVIDPPAWYVTGPLKVSEFGELVRLPGALGAPEIPTKFTERSAPEMVRVPDHDGPKNSMGNPSTTKLVEHVRRYRDQCAMRADAAFWWDGKPGQMIGTNVLTIEHFTQRAR